jgi:hypothetical protein
VAVLQVVVVVVAGVVEESDVGVTTSQTTSLHQLLLGVDISALTERIALTAMKVTTMPLLVATMATTTTTTTTMVTRRDQGAMQELGQGKKFDGR